MRRFTRSTIAFAVLTIGLACGGGGSSEPDDPDPDPPAPVASVALTISDTLIRPGQSAQANATVRDSAGGILSGRELTWNSSDAQVVSVSPTGLLTAGTDGIATITLTSEGVSSFRTVVVLSPFVAVSTGRYHSCALRSTGVALCWGTNNDGELGDSTLQLRRTPIAVKGNHRFRALSVSDFSTCGLTPGDSLFCWGSNGSYLYGNGVSTPSPVPVPGAAGAWSRVNVGAGYACGVSTTQVGYCWGAGGNGELGTGLQQAEPVPALVVGGSSWLDIRASYSFSCGLTAGGAAYCWGYNAAGQLGNGTFAVTTDATPAAVVGGHTFGSIVSGGSHTCALDSSAAMYCWGYDFYGQLGINKANVCGTGINAFPCNPTPTAVAGFTFSGAAAGASHTCGLTAAGAIYCWGLGTSGQLGTGNASSTSSPGSRTDSRSYLSISAANDHTCGVAVDSLVYCWGENGEAQLGDGTTGMRLLPTLVSGQP